MHRLCRAAFTSNRYDGTERQNVFTQIKKKKISAKICVGKCFGSLLPERKVKLDKLNGLSLRVNERFLRGGAVKRRQQTCAFEL